MGMTRAEFIKMCTLLGIGVPVMGPSLFAHSESEDKRPKKVIVIGAGPAGMTAAHLIKQAGVEVHVLEASDYIGGRTKINTEFTNFPLPLGAEWLHTEREVFDEIINDENVEVAIDTKPYNLEEDYALLRKKIISMEDLGFTIDQKFIGSSWFQFFETYVYPNIKEDIQFNTAVNHIDYTADQVVVSTANSQTFTADKVVVTVPLKLLQLGAIQFNPPLPEKKQSAINEVEVWDGCKAFIKFSNQFYPTAVVTELVPDDYGYRLYYDAAYGQKTTDNILGLISVGPTSQAYIEMTPDQRIEYMLTELDAVFGGKASLHYIDYIFQDWTQEPFAKAAYIQDFSHWRTVAKLGKPVDRKVYFAGDAYTDGRDWGSVDAAAYSAMDAVRKML